MSVLLGKVDIFQAGSEQWQQNIERVGYFIVAGVSHWSVEGPAI